MNSHGHEQQETKGGSPPNTKKCKIKREKEKKKIRGPAMMGWLPVGDVIWIQLFKE